MSKILIVVDMQNDFIDGALGSREAVAIVPYVKDIIKNFHMLLLLFKSNYSYIIS